MTITISQRKDEACEDSRHCGAIDAIGKLPTDKVVVDLVVHEPGYDRTVTVQMHQLLCCVPDEL